MGPAHDGSVSERWVELADGSVAAGGGRGMRWSNNHGSSREAPQPHWRCRRATATHAGPADVWGKGRRAKDNLWRVEIREGGEGGNRETVIGPAWRGGNEHRYVLEVAQDGLPSIDEPHRTPQTTTRADTAWSHLAFQVLPQ